MEYCDEQARTTIQKMCDEGEDWLYGDGEDTTKSAYQEKLDQLIKHAKPIQARYTQFTQLPEYFQAFHNAINEATNIINSQDEKYKHITNEDR